MPLPNSNNPIVGDCKRIADSFNILDELIFEIQERLDALNALAARVAYLESHIYELGEVYFFSHPTLRPGFMPCYGGVIEDAAEAYPLIWDYLQSEEGQLLCVTETDWQAAVNATWHTLANGTMIGWNGVGGCAKFVQDLNAGTLRMPDLRGCFPEAVGGPASPGLGLCQGDAIRNITGYFGNHGDNDVHHTYYAGGCFLLDGYRQSIHAPDGGSINHYTQINLNASRMVPTSVVNRPRSVGLLPCAYLGIPEANTSSN